MNRAPELSDDELIEQAMAELRHKPRTRNVWKQTFGDLKPEQCPDGLLPEDAEAAGATGFVYGVQITYPITQARTKWYVGSKVFRSGWRTYRTSSETVKAIIEGSQKVPGGPVIELEILAYVYKRWELHQQEDAWMCAIRKRVGDNLLNKATSTGAKLTDGRSKWAKKRKTPFGGSNNFEVG